MTSRYLFDTGALSLYKGGDPQMLRFIREVGQGHAEGLVVDLALAELQYKMCQSVGHKAAQLEERRIRSSPMRFVRNSPYLDLAWRLKCHYRARFGIVDCANLAVAKVHSCRIVTTDSAFEGLREPRVSVQLLRVPPS